MYLTEDKPCGFNQTMDENKGGSLDDEMREYGKLQCCIWVCCVLYMVIAYMYIYIYTVTQTQEAELS